MMRINFGVLREKLRFGTLPIVIVALVVLLYWAVTILLPQAPAKPDDTWARIQAEKVVRIGIDPSSPPFIVDDGTGKLSGFDVALANELANTWGVTIQYVYTGYDGLYDALNAKRFDLILSAIPYNPNKTQDVYFSHPYFNGGPVLVVRGDDTTTVGLESLSDKTIAVELGSNSDGVARRSQKRYGLNIKQYDSASAALRGLQSGQAQAAIVDPIALIDFQRAEQDTGVPAQNAGVQNWRVVGAPLAGENYVIAVRRDSPTLRNEIDDLIDMWWRNGKLQELQKQNF